eukprot:jgi/Picsp_1/4782/NSC_02150-R1_diacylglycerol eta
MDGSWESANGKLVQDWSVEEVLAMLKSIGLNSLVDTFRLNGVRGKDLVMLSDEDFKEMGMSGLQIKKVKNLIQEHSKGVNKTTVAASNNAPSSSGTGQQINQYAGDGGYGIPPPLPAQPGPYSAGPPAGYPAGGGNMMMQQQMPYAGGAGYMPTQQPQLQPPPASYGAGAGMPPPTYFPPPNFNQQQQAGGMMAPPPNQQQQQGCCTIQ